MIFVGDIAVPSQLYSEMLDRFFKENASLFEGKTMVCNFEGLINENETVTRNTPVLYNHPSVLEILTTNVRMVACLANNHVLDLPDSFKHTISSFNKMNILNAGVGMNKGDAARPIRFHDNGSEIILFNACWNFLLHNQKNPTDGIYINQINEKELLKSVAASRINNPGSSIVVFLHWSLDLETLPFPMYRQFSKKLIDEGADVVVGSHSHCVQGGESYKNGCIIYGLGNFFLPHNIFAGGKVAYPGFSHIELIFDWNGSPEDSRCHWIDYQNNGKYHTLKLIGSENFVSSEYLKRYSPYQGMQDEEYYHYFKANRRKRLLIPVYRNYKAGFINWNYTWFLKNRARFAYFLAKHNLIKWQN